MSIVSRSHPNFKSTWFRFWSHSWSVYFASHRKHPYAFPQVSQRGEARGQDWRAEGFVGSLAHGGLTGLVWAERGKENKGKKTRLQQHVSGWYNVCGWQNSRAQAKFFSLIWCDWLLSKSLVVTAGKIFGSVVKRKMLNLQSSTAKQSVIWCIV